MRRTATFVKDVSPKFTDSARLWRCDPPMTYIDYQVEGVEVITGTEYVVTSATDTYSGPETYIFPTDDAGRVLSWSEMPGSVVGQLDHERAIERAGYEVIL